MRKEARLYVVKWRKAKGSEVASDPWDVVSLRLDDLFTSKGKLKAAPYHWIVTKGIKDVVDGNVDSMTIEVVLEKQPPF